jgi:transposase
MKCKRTSDGRTHDHHTLQVMRQQAIKAVREGQTVQRVAASFGVNPRSVFRWLADFANGGQNALLAKPIPERPPKLSAEEMAWLARAVRDHTPQQFKFEFGLWTLMIGIDQPVFVIVAGHPIYKAKLIKAYVERLEGKLKLFYLPPYSPHLNPDETVWAHVKRTVSRQLVESKEAMKRLALGALRSLQKLPELVKSFFRQPECQYVL